MDISLEQLGPVCMAVNRLGIPNSICSPIDSVFVILVLLSAMNMLFSTIYFEIRIFKKLEKMLIGTTGKRFSDFKTPTGSIPYYGSAYALSRALTSERYAENMFGLSKKDFRAQVDRFTIAVSYAVVVGQWILGSALILVGVTELI